ncbi:MAG TPA: glycogen debranching enzyme GlgX, partial [bacterium]|nr:glycogen debranching enzyme GlgX [bacterium]
MELSHRTKRKIEIGRHYPLGAQATVEGVNFALYSQHAREVYLLLFDTPDGEPTDITPLKHCTRHIWHCFVPELAAGQLYGY